MEKIVEKYTLDKVFEVISKHKKFHKDMVDEAMSKMGVAMFLFGDNVEDVIQDYEQEIRDSASALACLTMLEKELKGEKEY